MRRALIPSPFVGANSWAAVGARLTDAVVVDYGDVSGPDWYEGVAGRIVAQVDDRPWVAAMHSSAGPFAPALAELSANLRGLVFVDAVLPHPGKSAVENAPSAQIAALRGLTTDGVLAPWDAWLPAGALEGWIPEVAARERFIAAIPRIPFAFLEAIAPSGEAWRALPAGYLQLSSGFAANADRAEAAGWTVRRVASNHLAMVAQAEVVATALDELSKL